MNSKLLPDNPSRQSKKRLFNPIRAGLALMGFWALSGGVITAVDWSFVQWLEQQTQTFFFELRGSVPAPKNIVILAIDQPSLDAAKNYRDDPKRKTLVELLPDWPWKRAAYAEVIERLMTAGARSVAVDVVFAEPSSYGEDDDQQLRQTLDRYGERVALAAEYDDSARDAGAQIQLIKPEPVLPEGSITLGYINFLIEIGGRVESLSSYRKLFVRPSQLPVLPTLAEAALQTAQISYPQPKGSRIFFYGPPYVGEHGTFKRVSFADVLDPDNWNLHLKQQTFKDKIVLIGPTATSLHDSHPAPFGGSWLYPQLMPGIEIHANAVATLMEGKSIGELIPHAPLRGLFVFVGVVAVSVCFCIFPKRPGLQLLGGLGLLIIWGGISYICLTYAQLILPTAVPMIAIGLSCLSYFTMGAVSDQLEKFRLRNTLERYVAAPVVQEILKQPNDYHALLKGRRIKAAVLFSDIRGFTTLSYKLEAEQLVEQLNSYFNAMVEVIIEAGGTVDKFIGDAVMAEFGSPVSQGEKNDAMNAIRAALGMRRALVQLREQFVHSGRVPFFNGIGINFGEVIAGDIGSLRRREYAVIGDAVNVASRVESLTKEFHTDILITDSLYQLVEDEVEAVFVGKKELRGREEDSVGLYSLIGLKGEDQTLYQQVKVDLDHYLNEGSKKKDKC